MTKHRNHSASMFVMAVLGYACLDCSAADNESSTDAGRNGGASGISGSGGAPSTGGGPSTGGTGATATGGMGGTGATGGTGTAGSGGTSTAGTSRKRRIAVAGDESACAVSSERTIVCWGITGSDQPPSNETTFDAVAGRARNFCARRLDGSITCWGGLDVSPSGTYTDFSVGAGGYACALRSADGKPECWSTATSQAPTGILQEAFVEIEAASGNVCARRADGTLACWGDNTDGLATPPTGSFSQIALGSYHGCAISATGNTCWGNALSRIPNPATVLAQLAAGSQGSCGILPDRSVRCWAESAITAVNDVPTGRFVEVAIDGGSACAIREDATVECWPPFLYPVPNFQALVD